MPSACQGDELLGQLVEKLVTSRAEVEVDKRQQSDSQQGADTYAFHHMTDLTTPAE